MILQRLLASFETAQSISQEEVISICAYLAQLEGEIILEDVESASKLVFHILSQLYQSDFYESYLNILTSFQQKKYLNLTRNLHQFRVCVRDKFVFSIILFTSLKYRKCLFIQNHSSVIFLQTLFKYLLNSICIANSPSLYILKLIEMFLRKREDILTPNLAVAILKSMNKAATSPLTGFKHCAHNISRVVIKSHPQHTKKYLCNFNNLPVRGIDLNDILRLFEEKELYYFFQKINLTILKLFCNNTDSRDASFYYETLTNICSFEEFKENIWPFYSRYLRQFEEAGEFYQSFLKYWIPITVKHYKDNFYVFIKKQNIDYQVKAYVLLEIKKRGYYNKSFDSDSLQFLKFSTTSNLGLKIICTYNKKGSFPYDFETKAVRLYVNHFVSSEFPLEALKCLKQFISQIFLVSHIALNKNTGTDFSLYTQFLSEIFQFCLIRINGDCCELAAQLLKIIWDVGSGSPEDLYTAYKIDRENMYGKGNNLYYLKLKETGFWSCSFTSKLLLNQIRELKLYPNLIQLIKERYLEAIKLDHFEFLDLKILLNHMNQSVCLRSSETIKCYTDLIIAFKKMKKDENYSNEIMELTQIFYEKIEIFDPPALFDCVLILDIFLISSNYDEMDLVKLLEKCLSFFEENLENNAFSTLNVKTSKILESFINNVIDCLIMSKNNWESFNKNAILNHLCKIIQKSNMKRPVSMAINLVQHFGALMELNDCDREMKIDLLNRTLNSLYYKQNGKIRRNPETRLVIHALCLSDKNLTKPYLLWSLNFMLEVLSDPSASDYTLSSTLHSLEVLVSDNSIHQFTLPFIPKIIEHCIVLFNNSSWIVRNADLQLLKSLIERFLGVLLDYSKRPKTVEDLFVLFPTVIEYFFQVLSTPKLSNSAVFVLLFFSESQIQNNLFIEESLENDIEKFRHLLVYVIKNYSNNFGFLAVKAFTSLCLDNMIPYVFSEIVFYIQKNFVQMKKNIFTNLVHLLQELYSKYKNSLVQANNVTINCSMDSLMKYLQRFNSFYFNLLSLKLYTIEDIINEVVASLNTETDYKRRIWLNNYIPYIMNTADINSIVGLLNRIILASHVPEFLQIEILAVLVDRLNENSYETIEIVNILIFKLTKLRNCSKFLVMAYAKTILLFYEMVQNLNLTDNVIEEIRRDFNTDYIYKIFIYVLVLAHVDNKNDSDEIFVKNSIERYKHTINDDEILVDLSTTVIYLYQCSSLYYRSDIIELTFYLLLNELTAFEMCKFISYLVKSQCSSILISFASLLKFSNLCKFLGDEKSAYKLLLKFYYYVDELPDELENSDTYYLTENDISIPKQYVKKIILKSLSDGNLNL